MFTEATKSNTLAPNFMTDLIKSVMKQSRHNSGRHN